MDEKLTKYTKFSGCGAKLGPALLDKALCGLKQPEYTNLISDFSTSDDAGIYKISDEIALVQTIDFFPPIVDDPFIFGQIAAANSLSDVYAMGGKPITALSMVCFPKDKANIEEVISKVYGETPDTLLDRGLGCHHNNWVQYLEHYKQQLMKPDNPLPKDLEDEWQYLCQPFDKGDRNEVSKYFRTPLEALKTYMELSTYPPPELLLVISSQFKTYLDARGKLTLEDLYGIANQQGEPAQTSGKQELYESLINQYL